MPRLPAIVILFFAACHSPIRFPPGGYDYPRHIAGKDSNYYYYPVRNKFSRRDSLRNAWVYKFYRALDEPNLSLQPRSAAVFRLVYEEPLRPGPTIITLTQDTIIVKTSKETKYLSTLPDTTLLTPLERKLLVILARRYPIDDTNRRTSMRRHNLDSLGRLYPQLYKPAYYISLIEKEWVITKPLFTYATRKIVIKRSDFVRLIDTINASGYWQFPPKMPLDACADGYGYHLEANTAKKYNFVSSGCGEDMTGPFPKACQQLIQLAGLGQTIHLVSEQGQDHPKNTIIENPVKTPLPTQNKVPNTLYSPQNPSRNSSPNAY